MAQFKVTFGNQGGFTSNDYDIVNCAGHTSTSKVKKIAETRNPGAKARIVERLDANGGVESDTSWYGTQEERLAKNQQNLDNFTREHLSNGGGSSYLDKVNVPSGGGGCGTLLFLGGGFLALGFVLAFAPFIASGSVGTATAKYTRGAHWSARLGATIVAGALAFAGGNYVREAAGFDPLVDWGTVQMNVEKALPFIPETVTDHGYEGECDSRLMTATGYDLCLQHQGLK